MNNRSRKKKKQSSLTVVSLVCVAVVILLGAGVIFLSDRLGDSSGKNNTGVSSGATAAGSGSAASSGGQTDFTPGNSSSGAQTDPGKTTPSGGEPDPGEEDSQGGKQQNPFIPSGGSQTQSGGEEEPNQTPVGTETPPEDNPPSGGQTPPQEQNEPPQPPETLSEAAAQALYEADRLAAGYDYDKALSLIRSAPGFADSATLQQAAQRYETGKASCKRYDKVTTITHIFFHSLVVDVDRAFDGDEDTGGYNSNMATVDEFKKILQSMYDRGFVLVSLYDVATYTTDANGVAHFKEGDIYLPEGKTPFLLSQDDVNYYGYMISADKDNYAPDTGGDGFAHRLVVDSNGRVKCEYMTASGQVVVGDYDLVPILDTFIDEHPDFAYRGARAMIAVTGFQGALGYRISRNYADVLGASAWQAEKTACAKVAQALRDSGYLICSHSYGHRHMRTISMSTFRYDLSEWHDEIESVVGYTDIFIYPFGEDLMGVDSYLGNERYEAMVEYGFRYFLTVDEHIYWMQIKDNYYRGGRRNVDGYRMYNNPDLLDDLFVVADVFEPKRPTPVYQ